MHRLFVHAAAAAAAVLTGLAAAGGGAALAGASAPAPPRAARPAAAPVRAGAVLTLPAGGRVLVRRGSDGPGSVTLLNPPGRRPGGSQGARSRGAGGVAALRLGGQAYAIPLAALPDLGRGLDLSLFSVGALERAERGGRVPVTLHYRGRLRPVPGVTVTRAGAGTAAGYLTAGSAARLGTGLAGLAGRGGLSVSLAGAPDPSAAPAARPGAGARTVHVTVKGTGLDGRPTSSGVVLLGDVANSNARGTGLKGLTGGTARFSGPRGTYWALAMFFPPRDTASSWLRIVVLPQFKVTGNTTVRMRATAATSRITLTGPRPASTQFTGLTVVRTAPHAPASALSPKVNSLMVMSQGPMYASPVSRRPLFGGLRAFTFGQLLSPAGAGVPYAYTLDFADPPGTIAPQRFAATPASLATMPERYTQDVRSAAAWETLGGTPWQLDRAFFGTFATPVRLPGRQVQYLSGGTPTLWDSDYLEYQAIAKGQAPGGQTDLTRLVRGGQRLTQDWGTYPLHPAPTVNLAGNPYPVYPSATRQGNVISVDMTPFSDNQFGHLGDGFDIPIPGKVSHVRGAYGLTENGKLIAHGNAVKTGGTVTATVSRRPSVLSLVLYASRAGTQYGLSATSLDYWTWHTRREPRATIPNAWSCPDGAQHCAVQPLITLDYAVRGLSLTGTAPAGVQSITVTAGHLQLAPDPAINSARVQVSLNGGRTWQRAGVRAVGRGRFRVTFTAPRSARVTLRVTARDTAGNSLTETILAAYRTAA